MALLLNIPPNKTLLRRHLATHFNLLIGSEAQQLKQECLENPDYTLLTATTKVKVTHHYTVYDFNCLASASLTDEYLSNFFWSLFKKGNWFTTEVSHQFLSLDI